MKRFISIFSIVCLIICLLVSCTAKSEGTEKKEQPLFNKKDGYILNYSSNFDKVRNAVDDFGVSFVIAVDVSGSMSSSSRANRNSKYIQAANSLRSIAVFIKELKEENPDILINVGVLSFDNTVKTVMPFTEMNAEGIDQFVAVSNPQNFRPDGSTAIGRAIEASSEILAQSGTILNSMIVITDGENNVNPEPGLVIDALYKNRNNISTESFRILTSTQLISLISFDIDSSLFREYEKQGITVFSANDQEELEATLKDLLIADISKLE